MLLHWLMNEYYLRNPLRKSTRRQQLYTFTLSGAFIECTTQGEPSWGVRRPLFDRSCRFPIKMYDERNSPNISQDAVDDCEVENYPSASPVGGITESKNLEDDPPQWECIKTFLDEPLDETEYVNVQNKASIGIGLSVQEIARKFYSTTSSVYAEHTISNPNTEQILFWYESRKFFLPNKLVCNSPSLFFIVTLPQYFHRSASPDIRGCERPSGQKSMSPRI